MLRLAESPEEVKALSLRNSIGTSGRPFSTKEEKKHINELEISTSKTCFDNPLLDSVKHIVSLPYLTVFSCSESTTGMLTDQSDGNPETNEA